jgi:hypothetical protein
LFDWVLHHTNTVSIIWRRSSFSGGGWPRVPFPELFQARMGTQVKPPTFRKLASSHETCQDLNPQRWGASSLKSKTLTTQPRTPYLSMKIFFISKIVSDFKHRFDCNVKIILRINEDFWKLYGFKHRFDCKVKIILRINVNQLMVYHH